MQINTFEISPAPVAPPPLAVGQLCVYQTFLDAAAPQHGEMLYSLLDASERARAAKFQQPVDCDHYIAAHGILRILLSRWTGIPRMNLARWWVFSSRDLGFRVGASGKPSLLTASAGSSIGGCDVQFSLS